MVHPCKFAYSLDLYWLNLFQDWLASSWFIWILLAELAKTIEPPELDMTTLSGIKHNHFLCKLALVLTKAIVTTWKSTVRSRWIDKAASKI